MILSVSRRTDIPNYYSDWFLNRIKEGYVYVRNPRNRHQVSKIWLSPETVDCIVFWTKNPGPMLPRLGELEGYPYYFQFTLTGYGKDMECNVPHKKDCMIPIFKELAEKIGQEKVVWRYDPIIFTDRYTPEYHLNAFRQIAESLRGHTSRCVISFLDMYAKIRKSMDSIRPYFPTESEMAAFGKKLAEIAGGSGINVMACAEKADLSAAGIGRSSCIDKELTERIVGCRLRAGKDRNQRAECGCMESIDVGMYNTCRNGCLYCYANDDTEKALRNWRLHDAASPLLCGELAKEDCVSERKVSSLKENQMEINFP